MTGRASPRVRQYSVLAALLLVAAVASQRVEAVVIAAPLLALLVAGLAFARQPQLHASAGIDQARVLEGEEVNLRISLEAAIKPAELELRMSLPRGLRDGSELPRLVRPSRAAETLDLQLHAARWGGYRLSGLDITAHDRLDFYSWHGEARLDVVLRVYPGPENVRRLLRPLDTQPAAGSNISRARGEGIEFADITEYQPGDPVRRVNWRASGRRRALMVNRHHPERSSDAVIFVDAYSDFGNALDSTLGVSVRLAAALAQAHIRRRDRVGVIGWGGVLRWLVPGSGVAQVYRILDMLVDTQVHVSYAWRGIAHVPARTLPANAQIVAVSALADERPIEALMNLAARGRDLAVIEIPPLAFLEPAEPGAAAIAGRLYEVRRSLLRGKLWAAGVPLARWTPSASVAALVEELEAFRRSARIRRPA